MNDDRSQADLVARLAALERREAEWQRKEAMLEQQLALFQLVLDALPMRIFWKRADDLSYLGCNLAFANDGGRSTTAEMIGQDDYTMAWADQADLYRNADRAVLESGTHQINYEEPQDRPDGSVAWLRTSKVPLHQADGTLIGILGTYEDITDQRKAEEERQADQERTIAAQQDILRELSTPLIPLTDTVVAIPLVGAIDTRRAGQIMETLLEGIAAYQADIALLDISGVRVVDTQVADALLRAARAAKLVGATVILTGVSAEIAQTIVHLGADMSGIVTLPTLREGLQYAADR